MAKANPRLLRARRLLLRLRLRRGLFLARLRRMRCIFNLPRVREIYRIDAIVRRHRILRLLRLRSFLRSSASATSSSSSSSAAAATSSTSSASTSSASALNAALTDKDIKALFCHRTKKAPCLECVKLGRKIKVMTDDNLKRHMRTAHSRLRFPCPTCANKFKFPQEVDEHRRKHHGRGP